MSNVGPAFPSLKHDLDKGVVYEYPGMSLRAYIATKCAASLLFHRDLVSVGEEHVAKYAVKFSDALIAELNK